MVKQPVDPEVFKRRHLRNQSIFKAAGWGVVIMAIIAAYGLVLWAVWDSEYPDALPLATIMGGTVAVLFGCMPFFYLLENASFALDYHHYYKSLMNLNAWNAQQAERARLRDLLKEEGL